MKTKIVVVAIFLSMLIAATIANASPFVVCDPYPLEASLTDTDPPNPEYFIVVFDNGAPITSPAYVLPDGRVMLRHDLGAVGKGKHVVKIKAAHSLWGESTEVPFTFRAGNPNPAGGAGLVK